MPLGLFKKKSGKSVALLSDTEYHSSSTLSTNADDNQEDTTMKELISSAFSNLLYYLLTQGSYTASYYIVSHLNDTLLIDAVGIGNTFIECVVLTPLISLNLGLGTIASQAFGAHQSNLAGTYLNRAGIINLSLIMLGAIIVGYSAPFFAFCGYEEKLIPLITQYLSYIFFSTVFSCVFDLLRNYAQAMNVFTVPSYIQAGCTIVELVIEYYVVLVLGKGILGAGICKAISEFTKIVLMLTYMSFSDVFRKAKSPVDKETFDTKMIFKQLKMQFLAGAACMLDWIGFYGTSFLVSGLDVNQVASYFISMSVVSLFWCIPNAINTPIGSICW